MVVAAEKPSVRSDVEPSISKDGLMSQRYRALTLGMVILIALCAFESLAVATAMPTVAEVLNGLPLYALSFGGTLAASVVGIVVAGRWSDVRGPAMALWTGVSLFMAGLLIAGLAPDMVWLLCGRIVQGFGSGAISVALYVVVARAIPSELQPRMFAAFSSAWIVPSLVGPMLSGLIVQHMGWRWVFLAVPLVALPSVLMLRLGLRAVPVRSHSSADARRADDGRIAWALIAATGAGLLHVSAQLHGLSGIGLCAAALIGLALSLQHLLPSGALLFQRGLPSVIALRGIASAAFFGTEVFIPLLLSREYDLSPVWAGSALTIGGLGWCSGSWYQGHAGSRWTRVQLMQIGTSLMALGILLLGVVTGLLTLYLLPRADIAMMAGALLSWAITGVGMGLTYPSLSVLTIALSSPSEQGRNSSALQLADALGVAIVLAIEGWLVALLLEHTPLAVYLLSFAINGALALLGLAVSRRTRAT